MYSCYNYLMSRLGPFHWQWVKREKDKMTTLWYIIFIYDFTNSTFLCDSLPVNKNKVRMTLGQQSNQKNIFLLKEWIDVVKLHSNLFLLTKYFDIDVFILKLKENSNLELSNMSTIIIIGDIIVKQSFVGKMSQLPIWE